MTDTINISPEAVEHLCAIHEGYEQHGTVATLRALSAALTESQDLVDRWINTSSEQDQTIYELREALTKSRAETAAAYERAAETAEDYVAMRINQIETEKSKAAINIDVPQIMRWGAGKVQAEAIRDAIRILATPDQTAALDKLIGEKK